MTQADARRRLTAAWFAIPPARRASERALAEFLWAIETEHPDWFRFRSRAPAHELMRVWLLPFVLRRVA